MRPITFATTAALALALTACQQTPTVPLEEAKRVSAEFQGASLTAPPKSVKDITAILDEQEQVNVDEYQGLINTADGKAPPNMDDDIAARFYFSRAQAAFNVGRLNQYLTDIRKARDHLVNSSFPDRSLGVVLLGVASSAERIHGNVTAAIETARHSLELFNSAGAYRHLFWTYAYSGNLAAAEEAAEDAFWRFDRVLGAIRASEEVKNAARFNLTKIESQLHALRGEWIKAEQKYRENIRFAKPHAEQLGRSPYLQLILESGMGLDRALAKQGRLVEAEIEARNYLIEVLKQHGKYSSLGPLAIQRLARVLRFQGRLTEAEQLVRAGVKIMNDLKAPESSLQRRSNNMELGQILAAQEKWSEAAALFARVETTYSGGSRSIFDAEIQKTATVPLSYLKAGEVARAKEIVSRTFRIAQSRLGDNHRQTAEHRAVLAMVRAAEGNDEAALEGFSQSLPVLTSRSRQSDTEDGGAGRRSRQLKLIIEDYIRLLEKISGTEIEQRANIDATALAFTLADQARSLSVQAALAASGARAVAGNPDLADIVRREQDVRKQISALFGVLANSVSVPDNQQDKAAINSLRARIDRLRRARAVFAEEIEEKFPEYANLVNPKPATVAKVQAAMGPGEALIATYVSGDRTYVWVVPKSGKVAFHSVPLGKSRIAAAVGGLRRALDPKAVTLGDIPAFDANLSFRLYRALLAPAEAAWKNADSLLIVAHDALGQLPFSVLTTSRAQIGEDTEGLFSGYKNVPWLARSHAVTVLPSVTALVSLRALPRAAAERRAFIGFGDPYFNAEQTLAAASLDSTEAMLKSRGILNVRSLPVSLRAAPATGAAASATIESLPRLPDTRAEVSSIGSALGADPARDLFVGPRATEKSVKSANLAQYRVVTFATHGLVPGELDGLHQPALAFSAPSVTGDTSEDGLLTMGEILGLRLDADWVVLSACNTAAGAAAGAEAFSGLGQAFFYAGTRAMLLSNWPVETSSARVLTTDLFRRQSENAGLSRAKALQQAMLGLIDGDGFKNDQGAIVFSYAHPIFWAPFSLVGDGGGRPSTQKAS